MIVDGHNDLLIELVHRRAEERPFERHWLPLLDRGGIGLCVHSVRELEQQMKAFLL